MSDDYARTGFGSRIGFGERPALLVIDMVRAYLVEGEPFWAPAYEETLQANQVVVAAARAAGVPVVWTTLDMSPSKRDTGWFMAKVPALAAYAERPELAGFHPALVPDTDELVVTKQFASAFFGTSLVSALVREQVDTVLLTGVSTSGCVRATTVDALQHGYRPIVVAEACGDRDPAAHAQSMFDLEAKYADVEPLSVVVDHLTGRTG